MAKCSPEKLAYAKAYRDANRDKLRAYFRARKDVKSAQRRIWNAANRDKQKAANERMHLKRAYGLTPEDYQRMVVEQDGRCAACGEPPTGAGHCGRLHIDHDHETGDIRGLLCVTCNQGLGQFKDSPARLRLAAMYLERYAAARRSA